MATGDSSDVLGRLKAVLPRWFPDASPILDGLMSGFASASSWIYSLILYARLQTRIVTATDGWLDLIAFDFFGRTFRRKTNQTDAAFRSAILAEILRPRGTRQALVRRLTDLTGRAPVIVEFANPTDCGGYGKPLVGYGAAGAYGSLQYPCQSLVTAYRPSTSGIPNIDGYGQPAGGYGRGTIAYGSLSQVVGPVTDADIYAAVESVRPAGTIAWVKITN